MITTCPLCLHPMAQIQDKPVAKVCTNSYKGNGHIFEYLCYDDDTIHHYRYNLMGWQVTYWPNLRYDYDKPYVMIRSAKDYEKVIYSGAATKNFMDFPAITDYLKLLSTFS